MSRTLVACQLPPKLRDHCSLQRLCEECQASCTGITSRDGGLLPSRQFATLDHRLTPSRQILDTGRGRAAALQRQQLRCRDISLDSGSGVRVCLGRARPCAEELSHAICCHTKGNTKTMRAFHMAEHFTLRRSSCRRITPCVVSRVAACAVDVSPMHSLHVGCSVDPQGSTCTCCLGGKFC